MPENNYKVSVIIVYTNETLLQKCLSYCKQQSLQDETELITIDNSKCGFSSAAQALNYGAEISCGEVLIFMHQDMFLWDSDSVYQCYRFLCNTDDVIAGVAGVCKKDLKIYGDICETEEKIKRLLPTGYKPVEALSVDECLLAMHRKCWESLRFDEETCDDWHFYGVDICYENLLRGGHNYILPMDACHNSLGNSKTHSFELTAKKMVKKYKGKLDRIDGTCIHLKCRYSSYFWYVLRRRVAWIKKRMIGFG